MAASLKVSELTALTSVAAGDLLLVSDVSGSVSKKVTLTNLEGSVSLANLGTKSIDNLSDVDISTAAPTAAQYLEWDAVNSEFVPSNKLFTLAGVSNGDVHLGTFTGDIITDNTTIKVALQDLETKIEANDQAAATASSVTEIDGNVENQILYDFSDIGIETNNTLLSFPNSDLVTLQNVKIKTSHGPAFFAYGSPNLSISPSTFFDGCDTERYETDCLLLSDCENLTITGSVFRNYPGALDFTTGKVIVVNGSTIRNCGSGIKIFGSVNTDVLNNVILGPADEFIPVADLYDSDYDGVNISVLKNADSQTPVYSYQQFGIPKDLTNTILNFDVYTASVANKVETVDFDSPITSGGNPLFEYYVPVDGDNLPINDITIGETQFRISQSNSNLIPARTVNSYTVYQISGIDYDNVGSDIITVIGGGQQLASYTLPDNSVITNSYEIVILDENIYNSFIIGDYVKLLSHTYPAFVESIDVWQIVDKNFTGLQPKLILKAYQQNAINGNLTPVTIGTVTPATSTGGGFFQRRNRFVIARGIISVA